MGLKNIYKTLSLICITLTLSSCLIVFGFGEYWGKGKADDRMIGTWSGDTQGELILKVSKADEKTLLMQFGQMITLAKSFTENGNSFLMAVPQQKDALMQWGFLLRYEIEGKDKLRFWTIKENQKEALRKYTKDNLAALDFEIKEEEGDDIFTVFDFNSDKLAAWVKLLDNKELAESSSDTFIRIQ